MLPALRPGQPVSRAADLRARCAACTLDLSQHDTGDGAAVSAILGLGAVPMLRGIKAGLIARQYRLRQLGGG